jgi:hypothetical protein
MIQNVVNILILLFSYGDAKCLFLEIPNAEFVKLTSGHTLTSKECLIILINIWKKIHVGLQLKLLKLQAF